MILLKKIFRIGAGLILSFAFLGLAGANANEVKSHQEQLIQFPVEKYQLTNGLTVLLIEDHSAPLVNLQIGYRVGSKDEDVGATGLAHLFEHMMFKGAKRYPANQIENVMQANGGVNNAFTTQDETVYYETFPSSKLELMLDIESDRMVNLQITEEQLKSEREVVKEERRMRYDNNVFGKAYLSMFSLIYQAHPYRWPVIGSMEDLNALTLQKCQDFYRTYYAPNNAVLVVAGDIDKGKTKKMIARYFESLPSQLVVRKQHLPEPEQKKERIMTMREEVQNPSLHVAYATSPVGAEDTFALDILSILLGQGESSRLHREMVYHQSLATDVGSFAPSYIESGMLYFYANLKPGKDLKQAERTLQKVITHAQTKLFSEVELQRAKNQIMAGYVNGLKKISGKARLAVINEMKLGDYSQMFKDLTHYQKVTVLDLQKVARKYLQPQRQNLIRVLPQK